MRISSITVNARLGSAEDDVFVNVAPTFYFILNFYRYRFRIATYAKRFCSVWRAHPCGTSHFEWLFSLLLDWVSGLTEAELEFADATSCMN